MAIPDEKVAVFVTQKPTKPLPPKKTVRREQEVHCVVSSRHIMLASEHFQTLLSGDFEEGLALRKTGHVTIPLSDDPDTLIILLNIVHGATRKVPRQVSLELLRKLAVMVNDYGMLGSVEFFADTWIDHSKREGLPGSYTEDVLSWLFVFFVFERAEEFKDMTKLTQRECDENFDQNAREILLPVAIVDSIHQGRLDAINSAITVVHTFISKYMDGETHCETGMDEGLRFACDSMLLGSLMKGSRKIGIWPRPYAPFIGQNFRDLAKAIRGIKISDVCGRSSGRRWTSYGGFEGNAHGLEKQIEDAIIAAEAGLAGLELEKYRKEG
ncbi:hypothetical protein BJ875DRAFT_387537 [Amylocarpus encephaloides]|uniref:BTB domain-containing protein n=1 Tax=Amylocarpus encephaloides TaxID=45428 RepID=A0A9P7Y9P9_9HELO|nr:hypothetical protein BJ875DRAFT_387537 [Amylocarpus encephaloides]